MRISKSAPIILIILFLAIVGFISFCAMLLVSDEKLTEIEVGNNRTVSIYAEGWWEISRAVYYEAHEGRRTIVPYTLLDFYDPEEMIHKLQFVSAEDQALVGVFDPNRPLDDFFIIIDFRTGEAWPRFVDSHEAHLRKEYDFLKRLQKENPYLPIPTPVPTPLLPSASPTVVLKPTPTNTLVVQPTYYTPQIPSTDGSP